MSINAVFDTEFIDAKLGERAKAMAMAITGVVCIEAAAIGFICKQGSPSDVM